MVLCFHATPEVFEERSYWKIKLSGVSPRSKQQVVRENPNNHQHQGEIE
jgi:hypothetical protein